MTDESRDKGQEAPAGAAPGVPAKPIPSQVPPPRPPAGADAKAAPKPAAPPGPPDPPPPAEVVPPEYLAALQSALPGAASVSYWVGDWTIIVPAARLVEVGRFLRDAPEAAFDYCSDLTAVDWPALPERFDLVYMLYSTRLRHRLRIKVRAAERDAVPSVTGVWTGTNWLEREVYDLFGINFSGHPDLRRILLPADWQGHPERKDYPLEGPGEMIPSSPDEWLTLHHAAKEDPETA